MTCSGVIVVLFSFVLMSVASEDIDKTNSVHDLRNNSLKSLLNLKPSGMMSEIILLIVAFGNAWSSFSITTLFSGGGVSL